MPFAIVGAMNTHICILDTTTWTPHVLGEGCTRALEAGKVIYSPNLSFVLDPEEQMFQRSDILDGKSKNVSFNPENDVLQGTCLTGKALQIVRNMMRRFRQDATQLVSHLFPHYKGNFLIKRTSYRPAKVAGRKTSWRQDDTRLHVDAFPSTPNQGRRLLRVFSNVHPTAPRTWRLGEPFQDMAQKMLQTARAPLPFSHQMLDMLSITKTKRTTYDHYMLHFHDQMKRDLSYQKETPQICFDFLAGTTWVVFTDQVSHAVLSGQFVLEQTFELEPTHLLNNKTSPQYILQHLLSHTNIS